MEYPCKMNKHIAIYITMTLWSFCIDDYFTLRLSCMLYRIILILSYGSCTRELAGLGGQGVVVLLGCACAWCSMIGIDIWYTLHGGSGVALV